MGRRSDFGISPEDILKSRQFLVDFSARLSSALKQKPSSIDMQPVVYHLKSGMKPIDDWIEDLDHITKQIQANKKLTDENLAILEDILSLLDTQFTEDLQYLYSR